MTTAQQRRALGSYGERVAARYLVGQGMIVLDRNWRCKAGELDLVLRDRDDVVVCEVKTRSSVGFGPPLSAVGPAKYQRLRQLSLLWVEGRNLERPAIRIDLVGVLVPRRGPVRVEHVVGVG